MSRKLFSSHQFITVPDVNGFCKFGISDYSKKFFVRFHKVNYNDYSKTNYGINHSVLINLFLKQTFTQYQKLRQLKKQLKHEQYSTQQLQINRKSLLSVSQQIQYDKFLIKKGQPFAILQTYEYDIELAAPVDMRVIELNHSSFYDYHILTVPYLFEVQCLNMEQVKDLQTQQEYNKSPKFFQYC